MASKSFAKGLQKKAINSGVSTGVDIAKSGGKAVLNVAKDESQCLCLKMTNKTHEKWIRPKLYLNCGATEDLLPLVVDHGDDVEYTVRKRKWRFSGIAGMVTYEWQASGRTYYIGIMFRKPMASHNNWNAVIYENPIEADQQLFGELKQNRSSVDHPWPAVRADANYTTREFGAYVMQGAMTLTSSGAAKLHIIISCAADLDE
jgi:hypothetical protein